MPRKKIKNRKPYVAETKPGYLYVRKDKNTLAAFSQRRVPRSSIESTGKSSEGEEWSRPRFLH